MILSRKVNITDIKNKLLFAWTICDDRLKASINETYPPNFVEDIFEGNRYCTVSEVLEILKLILNIAFVEKQNISNVYAEVSKIIGILDAHKDSKQKIIVPQFNYIKI